MVPQLVEAASLDGTVSSVAAGARHSVALTQQGQLFAWGCNRWGQLGVGHCSNCKLPIQVALQSSCVVQQVSCGWWHTSAAVLDQAL